MEFFEAVEERYSCRNFSDTPVEREKLNKCLEAAAKSPSACNSQPWKFVMVTEKEKLAQIGKQLVQLGMNKFALKAPALMVLVNEGGNLTSKLGDMIKGKDFTSIDAGIAVQSYCLAAAAQGLCTCILGMFDETRVKKTLGIPKGKRISVIIATGCEKEKPARRAPKKAFEETICFDGYK